MLVRHRSLPALLSVLGAVVTLSTACEGGASPEVGSSRSTSTSTTLGASEAGAVPVSDPADAAAPPSTAAAVVEATGTTIAVPVAPPTSSIPLTELPATTEAPTTTTGRRLYTVHGTLGVFPVSGTICAIDAAGASGAIGAPDGSVVDAPEIGSISYGGEVTFSSTSNSEGTFQYSIFAYSTSFTGGGTYRISWLDNRTRGLMDLYEVSGNASNPVVDEDDTSDQEMAMNVTMIGSC